MTTLQWIFWLPDQVLVPEVAAGPSDKPATDIEEAMNLVLLIEEKQ
jgi:hypothetical protein